MNRAPSNTSIPFATRRLQKKAGKATFCVTASLMLALAGCSSAPSAPPRQVQEFHRHASVGLEKYRDGFVVESRNAFLRALAHAEMADDAGRMASALLNLGSSELLLDNIDAASRAYGRAVREAELADPAEQPALRWQAVSGLAEAVRRSGNAEKTIALLESRPIVSVGLSETHRLMADITLARALADSGKADEGQGQLDRIIAAAKKLSPAESDGPLAAALHAKASVFLKAGQMDAAQALALTALKLDRGLHHPPSVAEDHRLLGEIAAAQNRTSDRQFHFQRALSIYTNTGQELRAQACRNMLKPAEK